MHRRTGRNQAAKRNGDGQGHVDSQLEGRSWRNRLLEGTDERAEAQMACVVVAAQRIYPRERERESCNFTEEKSRGEIRRKI
jgi:hypothetical protein